MFTGGRSRLPSLRCTFVSLQVVSSSLDSLYRRRCVSLPPSGHGSRNSASPSDSPPPPHPPLEPPVTGILYRHLSRQARHHRSHRWNPPEIREVSVMFLAPIFDSVHHS
uniref:Uncharacterized protein n=1 Tax=Opuntia streptacantha TaxID=393608 RepID=A0A7C9CV67_OPUST